MHGSTPTRRRALRREPDGPGERGTAVVLVPALVLVFICLGAIALDLSLVHAMHREAHRIASSAAEDAASMIDERRVQMSGEVVVDAARAERVARAHVLAADFAGEIIDVTVHVSDTTVDVTLTVRVPRVFLPRGSGGDPEMDVSARGRLRR